MIDSEPGRAPSGLYIIALLGELTSRGVSCDVQGGAEKPHLRIYFPAEITAAKEPIDGVSVGRIGGEWWSCSPQVMPVCPVTPVARAAETVVNDLGLGEVDSGAGGDVADLAVWRMLREARLDISRPSRHGGDPAPYGWPPGTISSLSARRRLRLSGRAGCWPRLVRPGTFPDPVRREWTELPLDCSSRPANLRPTEPMTAGPGTA